jgi:hypothetical protein
MNEFNYGFGKPYGDDGKALFETPKWNVYMFGSKDDMGAVYIPRNKDVPCAIVRFAMRIIGCKWVKVGK